MYNKRLLLILGICLLVFLAGCSEEKESKKLKKVGLLVPDTINDQVWGTNGYMGMLKIQKAYGTDIFYKENIHSQALVERAVEEFSHKGINIVFGHGNEYADYFNKLAPDYPDMHFVSFNGNANEKNTTSLKFEAHAMGFFGGMTAAHFSKTGTVGVVATYKWQPEVKGFVEGAKFARKDIHVAARYVENWDDSEKALQLLDKVIAEGADVVYPAGDGYNVAVIDKLKAKGLHAIGYVSDQSDLGKETVLTSTVEHADKLYLLVADQFVKGKLKSGNLHFDFADGVISLSPFSEEVDKDFQKKINGYIDQYIKTGKLPNKQMEE
ncbi:BMP family ABC transporter substrate-binding protein [Bacillus badius]|uniref:Positive regulator of comK n=1 Tax=Bacillus badius TaxID=1455 RepID=A0ABR5ASK2_BACBA|nr:BMP family ABC transporter substrate-binding protein [Bacillus badius]KIL73087.1 positive regulator of comK [Bacillus badius]KIL77634.1 positive regulator of comK [Bacillus badius]KZR59082.1 BMP family ABC transporter substrate-binding protein [Bacillus badius]MED4717794.1 BMP family ABC transporter substrate-binding protein [Bacillus badius]